MLQFLSERPASLQLAICRSLEPVRSRPPTAISHHLPIVPKALTGFTPYRPPDQQDPNDLAVSMAPQHILTPRSVPTASGPCAAAIGEKQAGDYGMRKWNDKS